MTTSDYQLDSFAESVELFEGALWADLQRSASAAWRRRWNVDVWYDASIVMLVASGTRALAVNRVFGLGFETPLTPDYLERLTQRYRDAGAERFVVQWSPRARPLDALDWMMKMGARPMSPTSKLLLRCENLTIDETTPPFEVREIGPADGDLFESIVAPALQVPEGLGEGIRSTIGQPGWHYYLALDDARPIAGAALYHADGQAWLGFGATLSTDRKRGAQSALIRRRLTDAVRDGCTIASTETHASPSGYDRISYSNLQRAGFELLYERTNLVFDLVKSP